MSTKRQEGPTVTRRAGWAYYGGVGQKAPRAHQQAGIRLPEGLITELEALGPELIEDLSYISVHFHSMAGHSFSVRLYREGNRGN